MAPELSTEQSDLSSSSSCDKSNLAIAAPVAAKERIETLDVIRGFALFGIMFVNVYAFVNPTKWFDVDWQALSSLEYGAEIFKLLFTQGKFYSLFALLFGIGFAVQLSAAQKRDGRFALRFLWRITILWIFGVCHYLFIWNGDILNSYAVGGSILLLLYLFKLGVSDKLVAKFSKTREKTPRKMALVVAAIFILGPLIAFGAKVYGDNQAVMAYEAGETLNERQQAVIKQREQMMEFMDKKPEKDAKSLAIYQQGSYADVVNLRFKEAQQKLLSVMFWVMVSGLFLIGAYIGRGNYIGQAQQYRDGFKRMAIIGFTVGMVANAGFVYAHIGQPEDAVPFAFWFWLTFTTKAISGLAMALMFIALLSIAMLGSAKRLLQVFAPVGRMALSNYLIQSLIGATIFYGYGLGYVGQFNVFEQFAYMVVLFSLQTVFSHWWLKHYQFGPVEWLWRSLTYWQRQPMKVRAGSPA